MTLLVVLLITFMGTAKDGDRADTIFPLGSRWLLELVPDNQPYPDPTSGLWRPRIQVGLCVCDGEIRERSSKRVMLELGPVIRFPRSRQSAVEKISLDLVDGLSSAFEPRNGLGIIGWDGTFGISAVWDWSDSGVATVGCADPIWTVAVIYAIIFVKSI